MFLRSECLRGDNQSARLNYNSFGARDSVYLERNHLPCHLSASKHAAAPTRSNRKMGPKRTVEENLFFFAAVRECAKINILIWLALCGLSLDEAAQKNCFPKLHRLHLSPRAALSPLVLSVAQKQECKLLSFAPQWPNVHWKTDRLEIWGIKMPFAIIASPHPKNLCQFASLFCERGREMKIVCLSNFPKNRRAKQKD